MTHAAQRVTKITRPDGKFYQYKYNGWSLDSEIDQAAYSSIALSGVNRVARSILKMAPCLILLIGVRDGDHKLEEFIDAKINVNPL